MEAINYPRILKVQNVCAVTGLSKSALYRKIREGRFPKPVKIAERSSGWIDQEVFVWIQLRIEESRA